MICECGKAIPFHRQTCLDCGVSRPYFYAAWVVMVAVPLLALLAIVLLVRAQWVSQRDSFVAVQRELVAARGELERSRADGTRELEQVRTATSRELTNAVNRIGS